jgi:hypothetical protein
MTSIGMNWEHVELGPERQVLGDDLGDGHPLGAPRLELEHRDVVCRGSHSCERENES